MAKFERILVTGAHGLVGSAIQAIKGSQEIIAVGRKDYDLLRWTEVDAMMRRYRPDAVIHLAAKVGGVKANSKAPATFFMENVTMNTHVLEAARVHCVKKAICFLSTCIFPDPCQYPLKPEYLHMGPPHQSNYGYAFAKRMLAVQCQSYNQEYGTNFVPVIPCNIYGPHDNFHLENGHVVPAMIRKFWDSCLQPEPTTVPLWGSGKPLREFIYSEDVGRLVLMLLESYDSTAPIILSTGIENSIHELAIAIRDSMTVRKPVIEFDPSKPDGQFRKPSDNTPLRALFPDFKFTNLAEGIAKTVDWYAANYKTGIRT